MNLFHLTALLHFFTATLWLKMKKERLAIAYYLLTIVYIIIASS